MHADDDSADRLVSLVALHDGAEPLELRVVKLIARGVVEGDEINVVIDPVVVRAEGMVGRIVGKALLTEDGGVEPVGKLQQVGFASGWRNRARRWSGR